MQDVPRQMVRQALPTTGSVLGAAPAGGTWVVKNILLVNVTSTAATATIYMAGTIIIPTVSVPANTVVSFDINQVLVPSQNIFGQASVANAINAHIAGIEVLV